MWVMKRSRVTPLRTILAACLSIGLAGSLQAKDLVVKVDHAQLLSACSGGARITSLPQGHKVKLRFAIAGATSPCYSVSTEIEGKRLRGYMAKESLAGLEDFERSRRNASASRVVDSTIMTLGIESTQPSRPETTPEDDSPALQAAVLEALAMLKRKQPADAERILAAAGAPPEHPQVALLRSQALLQLTRPDRALEVVEPALERHPDNADLLAVAGISLYQRDDVETARKYLKRSLEIQPNPSIEQVYAKAVRESEGDKSDDATYGSRFVLRYEGETLDPTVARRLSAAFEREINRISYQLGCPPSERFVVIIQSLSNYRATTGASDWSRGQYDGKIRVALPSNGQIDAQVRRTLSHEFVHACLARIGRWPSWLHEGLAQKFSGSQLSPEDRKLLEQLGRQEQLPSLELLTGRWAAMNTNQAAVAYKIALAAVSIFLDERRHLGVRNLMNNPQRLPEVTAFLDRRLQETYQ